MRTPLFLALTISLIAGTESATAQELGFLTSAIRNIHSVSLSIDRGLLLDDENISIDEDACDISRICGMSAEILLDVPSPKGTHVEVGIGASYFRGFREAKGAPIELRGAVRSFPTISAYVTKEGQRRDGGIDPYLGVSFGISDLWNVQAYDSDRKEYALKGQTFDYGAEVGVFYPIRGSLGAFAEVRYRRRQFPSVDWSGDVVPTGASRSFDFDAVVLALGAQVRMNDDGAAAPGFVGTWALARMDGKELPGLLTQTAHHTGTAVDGSTRVEVVSGELTVGPIPKRGARVESGYMITLWERTVTLDSNARQIAATAPTPRRFSAGVAKINRTDNTMALMPTGGAETATYRVGSEISVQLGNHVLQFRKLGS